MARKIDLLVIHCSATPVTMDIGVKEIREWHTSSPRNWSDIGYHYVIRLDGTVEKGRSPSRSGAHAKGFNKNSLGVCIIGGSDKDLKPENTMNEAQEKALIDLIVELDWTYLDMDVKGHNELSSKACPSFDVQEWLKEAGYKK
ncbi:N-acetylmuramoyl-L-alanine amidase [bacterium]|nr:N-acetylmuramoyl-L-alanine amidase [bacterium]